MKSKTLWTKTLSEEFWSGVVSPLMFSIAGRLIEERMARKGMEMTGLTVLENEDFFKLFGGQVYLNSRILEEVVRLLPSVFLTQDMLRFLPEEIQEDLSHIRVAFFSPQTFRILFRLFSMDWSWAPFFNYKGFDTAVKNLEEVRKTRYPVNEKEMTTNQLLERSRMIYQEMGDFLDVVTWGMVFAYIFHPLTQILARKWGKDEQGDLANALTVGLDSIKTFEINREIEILAKRVVRDSKLNTLFQRRKPKTILETIKRESWGKGFLKEFEAFLDDHGHRFNGRDILHTTWREHPETVINMIKLNRGSDRSEKTFELQKMKRTQAEKELRHRIKKSWFGSFQLALFSLSLKYNQTYFVIRENMRYHSDVFLEQFRRLYLEIGKRWHRQGILRTPEDVFYLSREEIEDACNRHVNLKKKAEKRKREYKQYHSLHTPEVITDDTRLQPAVKPPGEEKVVLSGEMASPGFVCGLARVIRQPKDILAFKKGEILVSEYTDPSWTPVLSMAAGMITEVGGFLSHGSIVAREYGIPTLIQVDGLVKWIKTGDRLELDTEMGVVRVDRD